MTLVGVVPTFPSPATVGKRLVAQRAAEGEGWAEGLLPWRTRLPHHACANSVVNLANLAKVLKMVNIARTGRSTIFP